MQKIQLETLSSSQRDQLLLQLLAEKAELSKNASPQPASVAGKTILDGMIEVLVSHVEDGHICEAITDATQSLEDELNELLWNVVAEESFKLSEDFEETLFSSVLYSLKFAGSELEENASHPIEIALLEEGAAYLGDYSNNGAFVGLMAKINSLLPQLVQESVSWTINTAEIRGALSKPIRDFVIESVLPDVARNVCTTETDMEPNSTLVRDIGIPNSAATKRRELDGVVHDEYLKRKPTFGCDDSSAIA